jgi:Fur family ferric uptake transcriptional regulator
MARNVIAKTSGKTTRQRHDVNEALKTFRDYLAANSLKLTQQRLLVFKVFLSQDSMLTCETLLDKVVEMDAGISRSTVYRTIKHLHHAGVARCIRLSDGTTNYEPMGDHHSRMICERCGRQIPLVNPYLDCLQRETARQQGFTLFRFETVLYGLCHACAHATTDHPDCALCASGNYSQEKP